MSEQPPIVHTIYGHRIDDATVAEVEAIGIEAWIAQHPEAKQWLHDWFAEPPERPR